MKYVVALCWFVFWFYVIGFAVAASLLCTPNLPDLWQRLLVELPVVIVIFVPTYAMVLGVVPKERNPVSWFLRKAVNERYQRAVAECGAIIFVGVLVFLGFAATLVSRNSLMYFAHLAPALLMAILLLTKRDLLARRLL